MGYNDDTTRGPPPSYFELRHNHYSAREGPLSIFSPLYSPPSFLIVTEKIRHARQIALVRRRNQRRARIARPARTVRGTYARPRARRVGAGANGRNDG